MMKGYKAAKMSAVAIAIALAIGCSSDTEDKVSDSNEKVEAAAQDSTPEPKAEKEVKSEKPATHHVISFERLGPPQSRDAYRTVDQQYDFIEIFQGLADWNPDHINADFPSDKYEHIRELHRIYEIEQDVFVKADKKKEFEEALQAIRDNPENKNRLVTYAVDMGSSFKPYDMETNSFKIIFPAFNESDEIISYMKGGHPRVLNLGRKRYGVINSITSVDHTVSDTDEARSLEAKRAAGTYARVYGEINTLTEQLNISGWREIKITPHFIEIFDKDDSLIFDYTF